MNAAPAEAFPVGEFLADELEARGWTQSEFAEILGRPAQFVSEIVSGKKEITRESAAQIGAAFGTSAQIWLNMQDEYLLWKQDQDQRTRTELNEVARRAKLNEKGPISLLKKLGYLHGTTPEQLESEVLEFFELDSLDDEPTVRLAARKSNHDEPLSGLQTAWAYAVRAQARLAPPTNDYSRESLTGIGASLPRLLTSPEAFRDLPPTLASSGVRLVYVRPLPGAKIDGCAMNVDGYPVIGLSGRGQRLDKVLFTLLHEIAHVVKGHVEDEAPIVEEIDEDADASEPGQLAEAEANDQAGDWLLPASLGVLPERVTGQWLDDTAARTGLAKIVIVGRLQHVGRLDWRTTHARNAPSVGEVLEAW